MECIRHPYPPDWGPGGERPRYAPPATHALAGAAPPGRGASALAWLPGEKHAAANEDEALLAVGMRDGGVALLRLRAGAAGGGCVLERVQEVHLPGGAPVSFVLGMRGGCTGRPGVAFSKGRAVYEWREGQGTRRSRPGVHAASITGLDADASGRRPPPPPPRTNRTRRVPRPVLIGHAASLTPY